MKCKISKDASLEFLRQFHIKFFSICFFSQIFIHFIIKSFGFFQVFISQLHHLWTFTFILKSQLPRCIKCFLVKTTTLFSWQKGSKKLTHILRKCFNFSDTARLGSIQIRSKIVLFQCGFRFPVAVMHHPGRDNSEGGCSQDVRQNDLDNAI